MPADTWPRRTQAPPPREGSRPARPPAARDVTLIDSQRLFEGATEVQIEHHGVLYRLKQTALGKLILTK